MRWPHQSWRLMHQSRISVSQSRYTFSQRSGRKCGSCWASASRQRAAKGSVFTNHWVESNGSTGTLPRSEWGTLWRYSSTFTNNPSASSAATTAFRASKRSKPSNRPAAAFIVPFFRITVICGRSFRWPIAKSLGSWAGVTLTQPVPKSFSTWSSATIGIWRPTNGRSRVCPTRWE